MSKNKAPELIHPTEIQLARLAALIAKERSLDLSGLYTIKRPAPRTKPIKNLNDFDDWTPNDNAFEVFQDALVLWRAAERYLIGQRRQCSAATIDELSTLAMMMPPPKERYPIRLNLMSARVEAAETFQYHWSDALSIEEESEMSCQFMAEEEAKTVQTATNAFYRLSNKKTGKVAFNSMMNYLLGGKRHKKKNFLAFLTDTSKGEYDGQALLQKYKRSGVKKGDFIWFYKEFRDWFKRKREKNLRKRAMAGGNALKKKN